MENTAATTTAQQVIAEQSVANAAQQSVANAAEQSVANAATNAAASEKNALVEGTEKKFTVKVMRVQLFDQEDVVNVQMTLNKTIPGFVKDKNGNYVVADVDHIAMSRSALTRALCEQDAMIATMRDGQDTPLTRAQLSTILHSAVLTITRTYHAVGFVPEGRDALTRDQWFTDIESVKLTDLANKLITQLVMQRMLG